MVEPEEEGPVTGALSQIFLSSSSRKILTYYAGYCCLFLFSYLSLVSTISFFHFLLDHEMSVIESWLNRNAWEVLILAKVISSTIVLKSLKVNNYLLKDSWDLVRSGKFLPERRALVLVLFLLTFFLALVAQFQGSLEHNPSAKFAAVSYLGSILFFIIDVFVIYSALANFPVQRKRQIALLGVALPAFFLVTTNIALPYLDQRSLFLFLNFFALITLVAGNKNNLANLVLYSVLITGPLSAVFGVDLVWGDSLSAYRYPAMIPSLGVFAIWLTGFLYYLRPYRPA